jgi:predicted regulator of Ras-like GTPase activity (Roadblock/LC7/MglB family)
VVRSLSEAAQTSPTPPPKIEGVGRLDTRTETVESGSGRIASIGKFLLDQKDLEKIGKLTVSDVNETKMRILTMEAASELQTLLQHIGAQEQVVGSVIVGHDGLLIANTMPNDIDAESIGVWALGVYMNTEHVIKKMGQDRVHQIVSKTPKGYLVIADFGGGLLVTVSDGKDTDTLIPLMRSITQLVAQ